MLFYKASIPNSKHLEWFLPWTPGPLDQDTWPLWGIFQLWNRWNRIPGWLDPGLSSDCVNSWNPLMAPLAAADWFPHEFHIGPFHYVCLCVCALYIRPLPVCIFMCLYMCLCVHSCVHMCVCACLCVYLCVSLCVCLLSSNSWLLFNNFRYHGLQKIGSFECQQSDNKGYFCSLFLCLYFESIFNDFSIDMWRGHLSYFKGDSAPFEYFQNRL